MDMSKYKITTSADNAEKMANWIKKRNGICRWTSINLSNPDGAWLQPFYKDDGTEYGKPNWESSNTPEYHITDPAEVGISVDKEVRRFHVGVRMGLQGFSMKVTDGGSRKIRAAVEKAGEGAYYQFDYETQEAVIMKPESMISLKEWMETNQK